MVAMLGGFKDWRVSGDRRGDWRHDAGGAGEPVPCLRACAAVHSPSMPLVKQW